MNSSVPAPRLLIVDDTPLIHDDFRKILLPATDAGVANEDKLFAPDAGATVRVPFEVDSAFQGQEALQRVQRSRFEERPYAVAFVDMRMPPGWDGIETVRQLWAEDPHIQVVICTAHSDYTWEETVRNLGPNDNWVILKKPFDNIEVLQLAHALSKKWTMTRLNRERLADLGQTVRRRTIALRYSENRFVQAFHANPVAVTLQAREDGRYVDANPAFCRLVDLPRERVVGATPAQLDAGAGLALWRAASDSIEHREPLRSHRTRIHTSTGCARDVLVSVDRTQVGEQSCVLTSFEDITERLQLEEQLRQSQKMEAIGQLAAGVAHDFNNLLTVIQSYSSVALDDRALPAEHRPGLNEIRAAADRAASLTRQLLVFSRRQITDPRPLDLAVTVVNLRKMLARLIPADVKLTWECDAAVPRVMADEANFVQVVMNLAVNACDALPPRAGEIAIGVRPREIVAPAGRHPDARAGRFVCISVRDNGTGIAPEALPRIFEPFFTTKEPGRGTGLGLSTVYGIVRQHEGWIEVTTAPGKGTTFDVFIPALADEPSAPAGRVDGPKTAAMRGRGERILLVEDNAIVRHSTRLMATRCGYEVVEASDGASALRLWRAAAKPFDLLLTDMVMPNGMNGAQLAAELRRGCPALRVVLSTGYSESLLAERLENTALLLKPYTLETLLQTLRDALDAPAVASLAARS